MCLSTGAFTGCLTGSEEPERSDELDEGGDVAVPSGSPNGTNASGPDSSEGGTTLRFPGALSHHVAWRNDTFAAEEACLPAGCATTGENASYEHVIDVSPQLPLQTPANLNATLTYETEGTNVMSLLLRAPEEGTIVYEENATSTGEFPGERRQELNATLVRLGHGRVELVVQESTPDPGREDAYQLRYKVEADNATLGPSVPVSVPVDALDTLRVSLPGASEETSQATGEETSNGRLMAWGVADGFLGHHELTHEPSRLDISDVPRSEQIVLLVPEGAPAAQVESPDQIEDPALLRPLDLETRLGPGHELEGQDTVSWEPQPDRVPVAMGLYLLASSPAGCSTVDAEGLLETSNGTLVHVDRRGVRWGVSGTWVSPLGHSALGSGPFEASFGAQAANGCEVGAVEAHWVLPSDR